MAKKTRKNKKGGSVQLHNNNTLISKDKYKNKDDKDKHTNNILSDAAGYLINKGARFFGFEHIKKENEIIQPSEPTILSGIVGKANQVGVAIANELNDNLNSAEVKDTITDSVGETVDIAKDILKKVDDELKDPEFVKEIADVTKEVAETASIVLDAADPAINKMIDKTSEIGTNAMSKVGESAVSIAINTAEAVPGIGAAIGLVRDIDKASIAGEAIVEAGLETVETVSDAIKETQENVKEKFEDIKNITNENITNENIINVSDDIKKNLPILNDDALKKKIEEANKIKNRTTNNINEFNKTDKFVGGKKYSKRFKNNKRKLTKRLKFKYI